VGRAVTGRVGSRHMQRTAAAAGAGATRIKATTAQGSGPYGVTLPGERVIRSGGLIETTKRDTGKAARYDEGRGTRRGAGGSRGPGRRAGRGRQGRCVTRCLVLVRLSSTPSVYVLPSPTRGGGVTR
jgi:hypothetical protein